MRNQTSPSPLHGTTRPLRPAPRTLAYLASAPDTLRDADDRVLAIRASEGDEEAFALLVRRNSSRLLALAQYLLGNRADAEDAVQDAFLSAWRRLPDFRHTSSFGTWMYRIVTNCCLNTLRNRPQPLSLDAVPEPPPWTRTARHPAWPRREPRQPHSCERSWRLDPSCACAGS